MRRLMIAALLVAPTISFAGTTKFVKEMNFEGSARDLNAVIELTTGTENKVWLNGTIDPDSPNATCDIEGDVEHKKTEGGKSDMYRFKDDTQCTVLLEVTPNVNSPKKELVSRVQVSEECRSYCGMAGNPEVFNGFYKQK